MIKKLLSILLLIPLITLVMNPNWIIPISNLQFILLLLIALTDFIGTRSLNLIQIWIAGFIFIIWSEITQLIYQNDIIIDEYYFQAIVFYFVANAFVIIGYCFTRTHIEVYQSIFLMKKKLKSFPFLIVLLISIYFFTSINQALEALSGMIYGTSAKQDPLISFVTGGIGIILPSIIGYYYTYIKKKKIIAWIMVFPIFLILLLRGSRFNLLFSILPFIIIINLLPITKYSLRKFLTLCLLGIIFIFLSDFIKYNRRNFSEISFFIENNEPNDKNDPVFLKIANDMSNEGVVKLGMYANKYFENHPLSLGRESSFLFIFWIPRGLWPEKPVMLDSWLIQNFEKVQEGFSSASGFMGELRADFGLFSLIFAFIIGILIKKNNNYVMSVFLVKGQNFDKILASISFPVLFFFIRSPIMSLISIAMSVILYFLLKSIYTKPKKLITNNNLKEEKL